MITEKWSINKIANYIYAKNQGLEGFSKASINKELPKDMKNIYISYTKKLNNNKMCQVSTNIVLLDFS